MTLSRTFLIRCWQEGTTQPDEPLPWRFALVQIGSVDNLRGFTDFQALVSFLKSELELSAAAPAKKKNESE